DFEKALDGKIIDLPSLIVHGLELNRGLSADLIHHKVKFHLGPLRIVGLDHQGQFVFSLADSALDLQKGDFIPDPTDKVFPDIDFQQVFDLFLSLRVRGEAVGVPLLDFFKVPVELTETVKAITDVQGRPLWGDLWDAPPRPAGPLQGLAIKFLVAIEIGVPLGNEGTAGI